MQQLKQQQALSSVPILPTIGIGQPSTALETPLTTFHEKLTLQSDSGDSLLHLIETLKKEVYATFIQKSEMQGI